MSKKEHITRLSFLILSESFTLLTIGIVLYRGQYSRLPMAIGTLFLLLLPGLCEKMFHFKITLTIYLLTLFYALGPMLGQCHNLYYALSWWDKLLHTLGGVIFALVGLLLYQKLGGRGSSKILMGAIFALCFSMAISVLWEFCEFGTDLFFGTDMQQDRFITHIHSYLLGDQLGVTGSIESITQVTVNGQELAGYIDIGLYDTMLDMILETLGALAVALIHLLTRGKYQTMKSIL